MTNDQSNKNDIYWIAVLSLQLMKYMSLTIIIILIFLMKSKKYRKQYFSLIINYYYTPRIAN